MHELLIELGRTKKKYWSDLWRFRELFYILAWRDIANTNLISKVYFPRMIIRAGAVIASLVDLLVSAVLLAVLMIWFRFTPDWRLLTLPLFTLLAFLAALGPGLFLTALNVKISRFSLRYTICRAIRTFHFASRFQQRCDAE